MHRGITAPTGSLALKVYRMPAPGPAGFLSHALPHRGLPREVNLWRLKMLPRLLMQAARMLVGVSVAKACGIATCYGRLSLRVISNGRVLDYGIAGYRVVTDAGVAFMVDAFQNTKELENLKFHGFGTGTTNEAASQTALVTELTTEYATDNTRPTGTTAEAAANIYQTVATLDPDAAVVITEHGVFDQASNAGGTLLDRTKFAAINLGAVGDTLQATYELTIASGG